VEDDFAAIRVRSVSRDANRRQQERDTDNQTPAEKLTKKIVDTKWEFGDGGYVQFLKDGKGNNHKHEHIVWIASDDKTVLQQNLRTADLYVWKFSADAESVTRYAFQLRTDSARRPRKSSGSTPSPSAPSTQELELNRKIVEFCERKLGQKVGNGLCSAFVTSAVLSSGGRFWYRNERGGTDFKWGKQVYYQERNQSETKSKGDHRSILPGDIILFRGCRFSGPGWWLSMGSHVAVIVTTKSDGRIFKIMHSNYSGNPKVQASMLDIRTLEKGQIRVFRPQPLKNKK